MVCIVIFVGPKNCVGTIMTITNTADTHSTYIHSLAFVAAVVSAQAGKLLQLSGLSYAESKGSVLG